MYSESQYQMKCSTLYFSLFPQIYNFKFCAQLSPYINFMLYLRHLNLKGLLFLKKRIKASALLKLVIKMYVMIFGSIR